MEVSLIGNSQAKFGRLDLPFSENGLFCRLLKTSEKNCRIFGLRECVCFGGGQSTRWGRAKIRASSNGVRAEAVEADKMLHFAGKSKSDNGGSWETAYGDFFLSWYSDQLISHGNRMLSVASSTLEDMHLEINAKIPLIYSWYNTQSHPSELTAGFYNTQTRNGYNAVAEIFTKNSVGMLLPGMDLSDKHQSLESYSSPESLLAHIRLTCREHGISFRGQNSSASGVHGGFEQIKKKLSTDYKPTLFTYQRMGASISSRQGTFLLLPTSPETCLNLNCTRMICALNMQKPSNLPASKCSYPRRLTMYTLEMFASSII